MHIDNATRVKPIDSFFGGFVHMMQKETADYAYVTDTNFWRSNVEASAAANACPIHSMLAAASTEPNAMQS
jgi:hypothetical protein